MPASWTQLLQKSLRILGTLNGLRTQEHDKCGINVAAVDHKRHKKLLCFLWLKLVSGFGDAFAVAVGEVGVVNHLLRIEVFN